MVLNTSAWLGVFIHWIGRGLGCDKFYFHWSLDLSRSGVLFISVSYTHLDVYKRQFYNSTIKICTTVEKHIFVCLLLANLIKCKHEYFPPSCCNVTTLQTQVFSYIFCTTQVVGRLRIMPQPLFPFCTCMRIKFNKWLSAN